jgi:hypothetical protein
MAREGFFLQAVREIHKINEDLVLIITGGFRSRNGVNGALNSKACNLAGLAQPAVK